jgi:hypothetical protein
MGLETDAVLAEKCHPPRFQSLSVSTTFEVCIKTLEVTVQMGDAG